MSRLLVLMIFKLMRARRRRVSAAWKEEFGRSPIDAWMFAYMAVLFATPLLVLGLLVAGLPLLWADNSKVIVAIAQYALFLLPISIGVSAEMAIDRRKEAVPPLSLDHVPDGGIYNFFEWDFANNYKILAWADILGLFAGLGLSIMAPILFGPM